MPLLRFGRTRRAFPSVPFAGMPGVLAAMPPIDTRQIERAVSTVGEDLGDRALDVLLLAERSDRRELGVGVVIKPVDRDDGGHSEFLEIGEMPSEVVEALRIFRGRLGRQCADGCDDNGCGWT